MGLTHIFHCRAVKTLIAESCDGAVQATAMGVMTFGWGMGTVSDKCCLGPCPHLSSMSFAVDSCREVAPSDCFAASLAGAQVGPTSQCELVSRIACLC